MVPDRTTIGNRLPLIIHFFHLEVVGPNLCEEALRSVPFWVSRWAWLLKPFSLGQNCWGQKTMGHQPTTHHQPTFLCQSNRRHETVTSVAPPRPTTFKGRPLRLNKLRTKGRGIQSPLRKTKRKESNASDRPGACAACGLVWLGFFSKARKYASLDK